jgi:hypothetical protein
VDIATSAGTPVRSIGEGTVVVAGWESGWGNVVAVKHTLSDGTVIYSNYAHLSKIDTTAGSSVSSGTKIGEVGNTGNSYGNHLHFQIDVTNQSHPYYYVSCGKGLDPMDIVNKGLCRDSLTANTIDPIAFLESGKVAVPGGPTGSAVSAIRNKPQQKADRTHMKTRAEIQQEEIDEFLKKYSISFGLDNVGTNLLVGQTVQTSITAKDSRGFAVSGNLPELGLSMVFDHKGIAVFPETIVALENGRRDFTIRGLKPGSYEIKFMMGKTAVASRMVYVFSPAEMKQPAGAEIRAPKDIVLGEDKNVLVLMRTKFNTPQLDVPYEGRFKLSVLKGKAKFCNASNPAAKPCRMEDLTDELVFSYADTYRGALQVKMRAFSFAPVSLTVTRIDTKKPVSLNRTKQDVTVTNPRGLDSTYAYYRESISTLERGCFPLKDGYLMQDREMVASQAKELVRRYLGYRWLKAGSNLAQKKAIAARLAEFETDFRNWSDFDRVSRGQLTDLILRAKGETPPATILASAIGRPFTDESGTWKGAVAAVRTRYAFQWKDQFGQNYFQPDKTVTVGEALYLVQNVAFSGE